MSKFLEAMQSFLRDEQDTIPEGWQTCEQIAKEVDRATCTVRSHLLKLIASGKCERKDFKRKSGDRHYVVPHYRMLDTPELPKGRHAVGRRRKRGQ